ncbi:RNA polymerase sigma factor [Oligoflexus tunisiensis]|uniref:RNA polymerase sigma factor n=1 Tax=Oligoflexus tunisiensis TaxID=708132 RepID=UPI00114CBF4B|nr:sigma-70 family RNA polymerase sigma factor [Oligoflexus tunisiensis]
MFLFMLAAADREAQPIDCSDSQLVQHYYQGMARYAVHKVKAMIGRDDVAAEIVQDVFMKLWQKKPTFDHERALYAWIYKSSHRAAIDYLRSAAARREECTMDFAVSTLGLEYRDLVLEKDLVNFCLGKLKDREAEIFSYIVFDGMIFDEIAELLGVSKKTIQRDWAKIKEKIEKILR